MVFAYAVRWTVIVGAFTIGRKEMFREKRTQLFRQRRNDLIQHTQSAIFFIESGFLFGKLFLPCGFFVYEVMVFCA